MIARTFSFLSAGVISRYLNAVNWTPKLLMFASYSALAASKKAVYAAWREKSSRAVCDLSMKFPLLVRSMTPGAFLGGLGGFSELPEMYAGPTTLVEEPLPAALFLSICPVVFNFEPRRKIQLLVAHHIQK